MTKKRQKKKLRVKTKYISGSIGNHFIRTFKNYNDWRKWENIYDRLSSHGGMRHQSEVTDEMFREMGKKVIYKPINLGDIIEIMHYEEYDTHFLYPGSK